MHSQTKSIKQLNYNHLEYFWHVARAGGVARAAEELLVSQPTISLQLKQLEREVGRKLFERAGRGLVLTDAGRVAYAYANEIFQAGQEMMNAIELQPRDRPLRLAVGVLDVIPKSVVYRLLEPALKLPQPIRIVCREDKSDRLLADLAARRFDVVLSDGPIGTAMQVRGFNHLLAETGITFFASPSLGAKLARGFPRSLDGAPMLLPTDGTEMRRALNLWFESKRVHPSVAGEFDDSATMTSFGRAGLGVFPVPRVVEQQVRQGRGLRVVGRTDSVRERYYAITVDAKLEHPGVVAIREAARKRLPSP
jgi:LysR family transcriptional activator of nhaA